MWSSRGGVWGIKMAAACHDLVRRNAGMQRVWALATLCNVGGVGFLTR
jgi:hypothetical protein